jgi:hypothetical protein
VGEKLNTEPHKIGLPCLPLRRAIAAIVKATSSKSDRQSHDALFRANRFILEAFDCDLRCPVVQTLSHVADIGSVRSILGAASDEDPEFSRDYCLDDEELAALTERFGVGLDRSLLESTDFVVMLHQWHRLCEVPYLIHIGYELPLLLEGRKKLARMSDTYPPMTFDG